jgi:trk system potassium uptake protein TrkH
VNFRLVCRQLGLLLLVLSAFLAAIAAWSFLRFHGPQSDLDERFAGWALLAGAAVGAILGGLAAVTTRDGPSHVGRREALLLVALSWLIGAALAASPFFIWAHLEGEALATHPFRGFANCYFESMSGLTTTGATILGNIEGLPRSLLLWRALTHWLGGLGIVVLFVAVLPSLGAGGKRLFRVEAPGPEPEGVHPHIRDTARMLWLVYVGLTVVEVVALVLIGRMSVFDSVCHTFGTLATGGFSTRNASVGAYDSAAVDVIVIVFMVIAGANFALFIHMIHGRWQTVVRDVELRAYLVLLAVGSLLVIAAIWSAPDPIVLTDGRAIPSDLGSSVRQGLFTTVSIQTTTGFCTSDFDRWPFLAKGVLVMLMIVGGCAGSTAGGFKVIRLWIALKVMAAELERAFRPSVIRPVRVAGATIDGDLKLATVTYVLGVLLLFVLGAGAVMLLEQIGPGGPCDFTSAATASIATLNTIGPGLARVGAIENYGWLSTGSKVVLSLLMVLGRLEVFAILVLFTPRFWRAN